MSAELPDYSLWLTPERLAIEEPLWDSCGYYRLYADAVKPHLPPGGSLLEFGCGTAWVPKALRHSFRYYRGIDANPNCLALAREKHAGDDRISFEECDIRLWGGSKAAWDVSCAFAFLKHFGLSEVKDIIGRVLWCARMSVFTIPMAEVDLDDGTEFPHVRLTPRTVADAVKEARHEIVDSYELLNTETVFVTRADWAGPTFT